MNPNEIIGKTFNRWHVDSFAYTKRWEHYYNCTCSCGTKKIVNGRNIIKGKSLSCGCFLKEASHERCFLDRKGKKYNSLTCIRWERRDKEIYWLCRCDCGNETWVKGSNLTSGAVKSCGCAGAHVNRIHGMSHTRLHGIWSKMQSRCFNPKDEAFKYYGIRGITVCDEWLGTQGFINFMNWSLEHGYESNLSIDRIDNDKGYYPNNCRWTTQSVQCRNTRINPHYILNGETYTCADLAEKYEINYSVLHQRLKVLRWSVEEAVGLKSHFDKRKRDSHGRFQTNSG